MLSIETLPVELRVRKNNNKYLNSDLSYFSNCLFMLTDEYIKRTDAEAKDMRKHFGIMIHDVWHYEDIHLGIQKFPGHAYGCWIISRALMKVPHEGHYLSYVQPLLDVEKRLHNCSSNEKRVAAFIDYCNDAINDHIQLAKLYTGKQQY